MEPPFVERRLGLKGNGEVIVRFLRPVPDDRDFRCDYHIIWPDRQKIFHGFGVDEVQALISAMSNAHAELLCSAESKAGLLTWLGMRDLGLPLAGSLTPGDFG